MVPEPKTLDDYEFLTLKKILAGCEFFRIVPEEEKKEADPGEKEPAEVAKPETEEKKSAAEVKERPEGKRKKKIDVGRMKALRNANWSHQKIAEDMGLSVGTVFNYLKKAEEEKCKD